MGSHLPNLSRERFSRRLSRALGEQLETKVVEKLFLHYEELRRWNARLSLIGPGTADQAVEVHYAESLAARALLDPRDRVLVDVGSGAGFPGLPLAAVTGLEVWLVEPRSRKWAFLRSAAAVAGLSCHCLDARVGEELPPGFPGEIDVVTVRALNLDREAWSALRRRLSSRGRVLRWGGSGVPAELEGWKSGRRLRLPGRERWILEFEPA